MWKHMYRTSEHVKHVCRSRMHVKHARGTQNIKDARETHVHANEKCRVATPSTFSKILNRLSSGKNARNK